MTTISHLTTALLALIVLHSMLAPCAVAQCANAREFAGLGGGTLTGKVIIDTTPFQDVGFEFGRIWESGNSDVNAGLELTDPSTCPSQGEFPWWQQGGMINPPPFRGIRGFVASPGCIMTSCPSDDGTLSVLVEDETVDGLDAGFIIYIVDENPADVRWWDHARTDPAATPGNVVMHQFLPFPTIEVTGSAGGGGDNVLLMVNYTDAAPNVHATIEIGGEDVPLPATSAIETYDIFGHQGQADPGRFRAVWTPLKSISYMNGPIMDDVLEVPCGGPEGNSYLAVGITFRGGTGKGVESFFVGRSLQVECTPAVDVPDDSIDASPRPKLVRQIAVDEGP